MSDNSVANLRIAYKDEELIELRAKIIPTLGSSVVYEDDTWACDKKRKNITSKKSAYTIYFTNIPSQYKNLVKDFTIMSFSMGKGFVGIQTIVKRVVTFLTYIDSIDVELININKETVQMFKKYLSDMQGTETNKNGIWGAIKTFLQIIKNLECSPKINFFSGVNPFKRNVTNHKEKYVPKYIVKQMDKAFKDETIPFFIMLAYWICRSIPSRIGEVLAMTTDCIKPLDNDDNSYVIFIPTFKQNGGYNEAQIRRIYVKNEGHGKFLIDMIKKQQDVAISLQGDLKNEDEKGLLFTRKIIRGVGKKGKIREDKRPIITKYDSVAEGFAKVINSHKIKDKKGDIYHLTTHKLRHNGITDRLYAGFTLIQTILMTAHQGTTMPETSYFHSNDEILEKVQKNIHNRNGNPKVLFRGRILNMDENTERRLLQNIKSRRIKHLGVCGDFTGCESFQCLACDSFIPDVNDLPYYQEQIRIFEEKLIKVGEHKFLKENIEYNLNLYRNAVEKIQLAIKTEGGN